MNHQDICLALDMGGTKLLIGEVDAQGNILSSARYPSKIGSGAGQEEIISDVLSAASDYRAHHLTSNITCIGMGMVGRVDNKQGLWLEIEPTRCTTVPAAQMLSAQFSGIPCAVNNDVRCSLKAEQLLGWGQKTENFLYINIGTGIGAGIVTGGHVITGASFNAGEVGHVVVDISCGVACPCGRVGCVEAIASGMGLNQRARDMRKEYPQTKLTYPYDDRCSAEEIFNLAQKGDALCMRLSYDAADALAALIMNLTWTSDPDTVVLGGGIVSDVWMLGEIKKRLIPNAMRFVHNGVVVTQLNPNFIGLIGAGLTGICHIQEEAK